MITPAPLVSVIVRSMDRPTLNRALASLAAQTGVRLEVVVVNAKGGRHTPLEALCGPFPVRLLNQGGRPLDRARAAQTGLTAGLGRYWGFLDDDDTLASDHYQHLVAVLEAVPGPAVAYTGVRCLGGPDGTEEIHVFKELQVGFARLLMSNVLPIHAVLAPVQALAEGVAVDERLPQYEDWDLWLQLARRYPFVLADRVSATYHAGGESAVAPMAPDRDLTRAALLTLYAKWLPLLTPEELVAVADVYQRTGDRLWEAGQELHSLRGTLARVEQERAALGATLADIASSTGWRVLAPLRWLGRLRRRSG